MATCRSSSPEKTTRHSHHHDKSFLAIPPSDSQPFPGDSGLRFRSARPAPLPPFTCLVSPARWFRQGDPPRRPDCQGCSNASNTAAWSRLLRCAQCQPNPRQVPFPISSTLASHGRSHPTGRDSSTSSLRPPQASPAGCIIPHFYRDPCDWRAEACSTGILASGRDRAPRHRCFPSSVQLTAGATEAAIQW